MMPIALIYFSQANHIEKESHCMGGKRLRICLDKINDNLKKIVSNL